jgi:hypothetical protein
VASTPRASVFLSKELPSGVEIPSMQSTLILKQVDVKPRLLESRVVEDGNFDEMKKMLKEEHGVKTDDIIAVEGCLNDTKIILGGRNEFMSHFCTLFNFNICFSNKENKAMKRTYDVLSDHDALNQKVDEFIKKFDEMQ